MEQHESIPDRGNTNASRLQLAKLLDGDPSPINLAAYQDAVLRDVDVAIQAYPGPATSLEKRQRTQSSILCDIAKLSNDRKVLALDKLEACGVMARTEALARVAELRPPEPMTTTPEPQAPRSQKTSAFQPRPVADLITELEAGGGLQPRWIWENYVPAGGLVLLAGAPKAGKTTIAAHMAAAIAAGRDFLGLGTEAGKVLWLGLEEHRQDVARRFKHLKASDNLLYQPGPLPASDANLVSLREYLKATQVRMVVVDTLSKFWELDDENDAAKVDRAIQGVLELARESDAAILLLHHTRKTPADDGSDIRGSSALLAIVDVAIILRQAEKNGGANRRVLAAHSRYSGTPRKLEIEYTPEGFQALGDPGEVKAREREDKLATKALSHEPQTVEALAAKRQRSARSPRRAQI